MFKWEVTYLECCGTCSIFETKEIYIAWSKYGVWKQFLKIHKELPTSYTDRSHFENFLGFKKMISKINRNEK